MIGQKKGEGEDGRELEPERKKEGSKREEIESGGQRDTEREKIKDRQRKEEGY